MPKEHFEKVISLGKELGIKIILTDKYLLNNCYNKNYLILTYKTKFY